MKKVSLIVTVLNENETIEKLLKSIFKQSVLPNQLLIVDGGSTDKTVQKITTFFKKNQSIQAKIVVKSGNRSIGRNHAIKLAKHDLIAITDAGCELEQNWLQELLKRYSQKDCSVVAGYYEAHAKTDFEKAVVPYALVMPDKVDETTFLPATRSMLIEKKVFTELGGFDETLTDNEDYVFAKLLEKKKIKIGFTKKAIVFWKPRTDLKSFYTMIFRFARGDAFAKIFRLKVVLIFLRYLLFILIAVLKLKLFLAIMCFYSVWAIQKNKKYVASGWKYLPFLQFTSDIAVMHGTVQGLLRRFFMVFSSQ